MQHYEKTPEQLLREQGVRAEQGLSAGEAARRLEKFGRNVFEKQKKQSLAKMILAQFKDVSIIILIIAAALSLTMAIAEGSGFIEPVIVFAVIVMNVALAVTQERSAENALEALGSLASPVCRVLREGKVQEIDPALLVPGDVILLRTWSPPTPAC